MEQTRKGPIFYTINTKNITNTNTNLSFEVNLTQPILKKPSDWSVSVIRYRLPNYNTPIFTFISNFYQMQLSYNGFTTSTYISLNSGYNPNHPYIFEIQCYVSMLNATIQTLFTQLALLTTLPTSDYPYVIYNESTTLLSLVANKGYFATDGSVSTPITLNFNNALQQQLQGFPIISDSTNTTFPFKLCIQSFNGSNLSGNYLTMTSQQPILQQLTDFDGIVLTSDMPTKNEYVGYNINNTSVAGSQISQISFPILQDFTPQDLTVSNFHESIVYNAIVPYRQTDLQSDITINRIRIEAYVTNTSGSITPVVMPPNGSANIKLMFTPKNENKFA
jgi:hypothetical protein